MYSTKLTPFRLIISYFFCSTIFQNRAGESEFALLFTANYPSKGNYSPLFFPTQHQLHGKKNADERKK